MARKHVVHLNPVWRERADYIIQARIGEDHPETWEQLWTRRVSDNIFEICCIPFFLYGIALGDRVETAADDTLQHGLQRVVQPSGRRAYRVSFTRSPNPRMREDVVDEAERLGCLWEWYSVNLVAIDAANDEPACAITAFLAERQALGHLIWEPGE